MTTDAPRVGRAPPVPVLLAAALIAGLAIWLLLRTYTSDAVRDCEALYHAATTAADTAQVDATYTADRTRESDPHPCGFRRTSARWQ
ncbi:MAG: hypothetical protein R2882_14260 [Gemmatimonadales bacterium]